MRVGDPTSPETISPVTAEIRQIDEHSRVSVTLGADGPPFSGGATLRIAISSVAFPLGPDSETYEPCPIRLASASCSIRKARPRTWSPKSTQLSSACQTGAYSGRGLAHGPLGTDGAILNLQVLSGHPLLVSAALSRKALGLQTDLVNGNAVEANVRVTVNFTLSDR